MRLGPCFVATTLAVCAAPSAFARPITPTALRGKYAFEWTRGPRKCERVDKKLIAKFVLNWACRTPDDTQTASGRPLDAICRPKAGKAEYLVFATQADCEEERETQKANGE